MSSQTPLRLGPETTPKVIQALIWITCLISLTSALIDPLFSSYFKIMGPQRLLALSSDAINYWYVWQLVSYLFVESAYGGISLWFILSLLFNMYILWMMGTMIIDQMGDRSFLRFYLFSGIFAGLVTLPFILLGGSYAFLSGASTAIFAIIVVWTMVFPELELLFFFLFPIKAKWMTLALLGVVALMSISQGNLLSFVSIYAGGIYGYLYGVLALKLHSPFKLTHGFEDFLIDNLKWRGMGRNNSAKIYDFKTGRAIDADDEFMDRMLEKISKNGEKSLSWNERRRMNKISKKRQERKGP